MRPHASTVSASFLVGCPSRAMSSGTPSPISIAMRAYGPPTKDAPEKPGNHITGARKQSAAATASTQERSRVASTTARVGGVGFGRVADVYRTLPPKEVLRCGVLGTNGGGPAWVGSTSPSPPRGAPAHRGRAVLGMTFASIAARPPERS